MNLIVLVCSMLMGILIVKATEPGESAPLKSLCVLDGVGNCWISEAHQQARKPESGDYVLSSEDLNRILEKLKSCESKNLH